MTYIWYKLCFCVGCRVFCDVGSFFTSTIVICEFTESFGVGCWVGGHKFGWSQGRTRRGRPRLVAPSDLSLRPKMHIFLLKFGCGTPSVCRPPPGRTLVPRLGTKREVCLFCGSFRECCWKEEMIFREGLGNVVKLFDFLAGGWVGMAPKYRTVSQRHSAILRLDVGA